TCALAPASSWSAGPLCRRVIPMTSSLRRKLRITARGRNTWPPTALSVYALALWLATAGAWAQEQSPHADANGWAPPPTIRKAFSSPSPARSHTGGWERGAVEKEAGETAEPSSNAYDNPATGGIVCVLPLPPLAPSDDVTS